MMKHYTIQSYVPEENFLLGKDARFCRTSFEDCLVVDVTDCNRIIAARQNFQAVGKSIEQVYSLSPSDADAIKRLFDRTPDFLMLPAPCGTLLVYPAWHRLGFALVFRIKESLADVEKAYKNAQRYAFSAIFDATENNQIPTPETKFCVLRFYVDHLFGNEREENVTAHILMLANLAGCHLHEVSASHISFTRDDRDLERFGAYLLCALLTMRRHNGEVSALVENDENTTNIAHVSQEYGIRIQQSARTRIATVVAFDIPTASDIASFAEHPAFQGYTIEETDEAFRLHIPLRQKVLLSSFSSRGVESEIILTLFPLK